MCDVCEEIVVYDLEKYSDSPVSSSAYGNCKPKNSRATEGSPDHLGDLEAAIKITSAEDKWVLSQIPPLAVRSIGAVQNRISFRRRRVL